MNDRSDLNHDPLDLVGLLAGEMGRSDTIYTARHLKACRSCTEQLIDLAVAHGALTSAACAHGEIAVPIASASRLGSPVPDSADSLSRGADIDHHVLPTPTLHPEDTNSKRQADRSGHRRRLPLVAATAVAVVALGAFGSTALQARHSSTPTLVSQVALRRLDAPPNAAGSVTVMAEGSTRQMTVTTRDLAHPPGQSFYEVWLLDPTTQKMLPLGVLPPSGTGAYVVGADLMAGYSAVDVSLQPNDGNPTHSQTSVLRASYGVATT